MVDPGHSPPRPLTALTLGHSLRNALFEAGYKTTADVLPISADDLSAELSISLAQAQDIHRQCSDPPGPSNAASSPTRPPGATSASTSARNGSNPHPAPTQLPITQIQSASAASLLSTAALRRFSTCIDALDELLGELASPYQNQSHDNGAGKPIRKGKEKAMGITTGMNVEVAGPPGIGKTGIALGMMLEARLRVYQMRKRRRSSQSSIVNGNGNGNEGAEGDDTRDRGGEVLLIDTEGGMPPDRLFKIAELSTRNSRISPKAILDGVHLVRISTQVQMIAFLNQLDEWLLEHPAVNLVIIDTLSFHFRQPSLDINNRRRIMEIVKQQIAKATTVHGCAVIVNTQMATKLLSAEGKRVNFDTGEKAVLMPQLGESWQTAKTVRVALCRGQPGNEIRWAHVSTSADVDGGEWARFDVDADGLPMGINV